MDSWDDDEFEVPTFTAPAPAETNLTSWDDEEEEEEEVVEETTSTTANDGPKGPLKPKQKKKLKMKEIEQKREHEIAMTKARLAAQANETDAERKAREKSSIEEADFEVAIDAFGPSARKDAAAASGTTGGDNVESVINGMRLLSLADHERLGELVANRISTSNAKYALECMSVILTRGSINLTADDIKSLTTILNVIKNEKIAAAKPKTKKKKVTGRQGYANVERSGGHEEDYGDYDDFDDFM